MKCENIALYDMDGTLANYELAIRRDLKKITNPDERGPFHESSRLVTAARQGFDPMTCEIHGDLPKWLNERIWMIRNQPDWWLNLIPLEAQFDLLRVTKKMGFVHHILTKGPRHTHQAWTQKVQWCHKHVKPIVPDMKVTITEDKGLAYGRVLIDDFPDYMDRWLEYRPRGLGIMPAHAWNENYSHPNVIRYDGTNLPQVVAALEVISKREAGESWTL